MKNTICLLLFTIVLISCNSEKTEKEEIDSAIQSIFENFQNPNFESFKEISTEKIYCIICYLRPNSEIDPYMTERKVFFDDFLENINNSESFSRAQKSDEIIYVKEDNSHSYITVYFTTWKEGELAENHEGSQLGFYLKKVNGKFKFAGIETIP